MDAPLNTVPKVKHHEHESGADGEGSPVSGHATMTADEARK